MLREMFSVWPESGKVLLSLIRIKRGNYIYACTLRDSPDDRAMVKALSQLYVDIEELTHSTQEE